MIDVVSLCQQLIRFPSVTPQSAGCLEYIAELLIHLGFEVQFLEFGSSDQVVKNIYARYGTKGPHLNFLGHVDVVPPGPLHSWTHGPFEGIIENDRLYGRGAVDMKGAIACFISAVAEILPSVTGTLSIVLTADEEGPAVNGTQKVVQWLKDNQYMPDFCLVGEPTNPTISDKMIKIGRRGSLNVGFESQGIQGHVAYPEKALNPIPPLVDFLKEILKMPLDNGTDEFDASGLQITTIDCRNTATNIIPNFISAKGNIRFNPLHSANSLTKWLQTKASSFGVNVCIVSSNEPFLTKPGKVHYLLQQVVHNVTALTPSFSTTGGTSDARFMHALCPVMEFGLMNETMHKIDEHVLLDDLRSLKTIYQEFVVQFFKLDIVPHSS